MRAMLLSMANQSSNFRLAMQNHANSSKVIVWVRSSSVAPADCLHGPLMAFSEAYAHPCVSFLYNLTLWAMSSRWSCLFAAGLCAHFYVVALGCFFFPHSQIQYGHYALPSLIFVSGSIRTDVKLLQSKSWASLAHGAEIDLWSSHSWNNRKASGVRRWYSPTSVQWYLEKKQVYSDFWGHPVHGGCWQLNLLIDANDIETIWYFVLHFLFYFLMRGAPI